MRIRTIKPEFWVSENVGKLSRDARLLFIGLWSFADDSGRGRGALPAISGALFPYDLDAIKRLDSWFCELEKAGMVRRYVVKGSTFYDIPNWLEHQKIEKPSKSKFPSFTEPSPTIHRILPDISGGEQGTGNREQGMGTGKEGNVKTLSCEPSGSRPPIDWNLIVEWWNRIAEKNQLSKINGMTELRKKKWQTRITAGMDMTKVEEAINAAGDFIREGWFNFDWFIESENNLAKLVEGKYAAKENRQPGLAIGQRLDADPASESPLVRAARRDAANAERIAHAGK